MSSQILSCHECSYFDDMNKIKSKRKRERAWWQCSNLVIWSKREKVVLYDHAQAQEKERESVVAAVLVKTKTSQASSGALYLPRQDKQTNNSEIPMCAISYIYCGQKWPLEIYGAYPRPQKSLFSLLTWINPPPFANISTLQTLQLSILWFWNSKSECETLPLPMFQHCNCQCFIACKRCECESCKRPFLCCDLPNLRNKLKLKFNCENSECPPLWLAQFRIKY